mmetsp:Transcript_35968/g.102714  ORF Transcript_35968/g.102714 Transcript_35968/m.102714 type:complete len:584 (-) Transcript_35968:6-1757(-)
MVVLSLARAKRAAAWTVLSWIIGGTAAYVYFRRICREKLYIARFTQFWSHVGPITCHYRWVEWRSRNDADREAQIQQLHVKYAPIVRRLIGELRGMFTKVAQVLSIVPNLLPEEYRREFVRLQNDGPQVAWQVIRSSIEEDLGAPLGELFERIEREPLGSASLGQAHLATWRGRAVVVKVQFLEAASALRADFDCLEALAGLSKTPHIPLPILQRIRKQFEQELDYSREAYHLQTLHQAIRAAPEFWGRVVVPAPIPELTRGRVLTMDYIPGPKVDAVLVARLKALGVDVSQGHVPGVLGLEAAREGGDGPDGSAGAGLAEGASGKAGAVPQPAWQRVAHRALSLAAAVVGPRRFVQLLGVLAEVRLRCQRRRGVLARGSSTRELRATLQMLLDLQGFQFFFCPVFNGDPHPGNILAMPDGRVGLIDLGQCVEFEPKIKVGFAHLIVTLTLPQSPETDSMLCDILLAMGVATARGDRTYLTFLARLCLTALKPAWFENDYIWKMLSSDRIVEEPIEMIFATRVANLYRGLGLALVENVDVARAWLPWARRWLDENPGAMGAREFLGKHLQGAPGLRAAGTPAQ